MYTLLKIVQGSAFPPGLYRLEDGILSGAGVRVNLAEHLVSVQIISSVDQLDRTYSGTLASGVLGFALLGPLGAVGGMLVGGRKKHIKSTISMGVLDDGRVFLLDGSPSDYASLTALVSTRNKRVNLIELPVTKNLQISNSMKSEAIQVEMRLQKKRGIKLKTDEKKCPSCLEVVKIAALKCRHCKSNI